LGADVVHALDGFWRLQFEYDQGYEYLPATQGPNCSHEGVTCLFPSGYILIQALVQNTWGSPMYCTNLSTHGLVCARPQSEGDSRRSAVETTKVASILRCYSAGACAKNNHCLQNRTGPLCGVCSAGYAMTSEGIRNLQFYLQNGLILIKVSRVVQYTQKPWLKNLD
jgi:hypothetical protein